MSDNENEKRETVENIVAEMRRREKSHCYPKVARNIMHQYSDRIEAAWKRERGYERVGNSDSFNAAAMREALEFCLRIIGENGIRGNVFLGDIQEAHRAITAALSAPARNCDIYTTSKDADRAITEYCSKMAETGECAKSCPYRESEGGCAFGWLLATSAERKGEGK